jgi:hypothetical protein
MKLYTFRKNFEEYYLIWMRGHILAQTNRVLYTRGIKDVYNICLRPFSKILDPPQSKLRSMKLIN